MNNQTAAIITSIIIDVTLALDKLHKPYAPPVKICSPLTDIIPVTDCVLVQCGRSLIFVKARKLKISIFIEDNLQHVSTNTDKNKILNSVNITHFGFFYYKNEIF